MRCESDSLEGVYIIKTNILIKKYLLDVSPMLLDLDKKGLSLKLIGSGRVCEWGEQPQYGMGQV